MPVRFEDRPEGALAQCQYGGSALTGSLHRAADAVEQQGDLGSKAVHGGHDRDRDPAGNQRVFDGGCAVFIGQKRLYAREHAAASWLVQTWRRAVTMARYFLWRLKAGR